MWAWATHICPIVSTLVQLTDVSMAEPPPFGVGIVRFLVLCCCVEKSLLYIIIEPVALNLIFLKSYLHFP